MTSLISVQFAVHVYVAVTPSDENVTAPFVGETGVSHAEI